MQKRIRALYEHLPEDECCRQRPNYSTTLQSCHCHAPSVGDQIATIVVRTEGRTLGVITECELQNGHAWKAELLPQFFDRRSDDAKVFRDNRQWAKGVLQGLQKIFSWPFDPASMSGGRFGGGNLPVRFK